MKTTLLTLIAFAISLSSFGQAPEAFKYQAVVRDGGGIILTNQPIGYQLTILQGSPSGTAVYTETFSPTTNGYGLVNLEIGTGTTVDDFTIIDWANGPFFMETALDVTGGVSYVVMGTSQLMSVPYALHAKTAENVINDAVDDADNDPTNEIETWATLAGIPTDIIDGDDVDDADADPTNEYNTSVVLNGTDLETTDNGSTITTDLSSLVNDADYDPTNELQDWTTLPNIPADFSDNVDNIDDADNDPLNEIQSLSLSGADLTISGGNTVTLPQDDDWIISGNDLYNANIGNVGIGTTNPAFKFQITDLNGGLFFDATSGTSNRIKSTANDIGIGRDLLLNAGANGGLSPDIYIKTNGNVGIGTNNPAALFTVSKELVGYDSTLFLTNKGQLLIGSNPLVSASHKIQVSGSLLSSDSNFVVNNRGNIGIGLSFYNGKSALRIHRSIGNTALNGPGQHDAQIRITNGIDNKALVIGVLDDGVGFIQSNEVNVGYQNLLLNPVSGNVGIGTTNPITKLHLKGPSWSSFLIESTGPTADAEIWLKNSEKTWRINGDNDDSDKFKISLWDDYSGLGGNLINEGAITIDTNGYVGIGMIYPQEQLHVSGNITAGSANGSYLTLGDPMWNVQIKDSVLGTFGSSMIFNTQSNPKMVITGGVGNVGIGTLNPARRLHVNDVMRLEPRAAAPSNPSEGDIYMDSITHKLMVYDGTVWQACF